MYLVRGRQYKEDPSAKLGGGSEGSVYPFPDDAGLCVKIFHEPDGDDPDAGQIAKYRAAKVEAICSLGLKLPDQFIIPLEPTRDKNHHVNGFLMRRVPRGFHKLMKLLEPAFRIDHDIGLTWILEEYANIFEDLTLLHDRFRLVIGDVNLGCRMFEIGHKQAWVDADSWSYPKFPCLATTEMFAHPDLFPNLRPGGKFVEPKSHHDRFSFTVALVLTAVHGAHPFRMGAHPSVRSLQDRARKGITIFDKDVNYPPFLPRPEVLSDQLLHEVIQILKRKTTDPLKPDFLRNQAQETVKCQQCDLEYHSSRPHCPKCQVKTTIIVQQFELVIEELLRLPGKLLFAQMVGDILHLACRSAKGELLLVTINQQKRATTINTGLPVFSGARYRFFDSCLAVCLNPYAAAPAPIELYLIEGGRLRRLQDTSTGVLENEAAVFDTSAKHLYRTAGNGLMCGSLFNDKFLADEQVMQIHRSQSWFTVDRSSGADREALFGYDRALKDWRWFIASSSAPSSLPKGRDRGAKHFSSYEVVVAPLRGGEKLDDFSVCFNSSAALLARKTRYRGSQVVRYAIVNLNGKVEHESEVAEGETGFECWENLPGKLFQGSSILHVTAGGVVRQSLPATYTELKDTIGVVTADDRLFRFGQSVGVIHGDTILTIKKK